MGCSKTTGNSYNKKFIRSPFQTYWFKQLFKPNFHALYTFQKEKKKNSSIEYNNNLSDNNTNENM